MTLPPAPAGSLDIRPGHNHEDGDAMSLNAQSAPSELPGYSDEVLNASWLPQTVLNVLGLESSQVTAARTRPVSDPETFLQRIYRVQE